MFQDAFVNLYTSDIEAGLRFYRDLLGFTESFRTPNKGVPEHVELRLNGFMIAWARSRRRKGAIVLTPRPAVLRWSSSFGPTTSTRRAPISPQPACR